MTGPAIVWFRQDLRLADNPALSAAVDTGRAILPVYILDDETSGRWAMGGEPWRAPAELLKDAGVVLDKTYPLPIVDHQAAREAALAAYKSIKNAG